MTAQTFRKKPVEIEAMQWTGDNTSDVIDWVLSTGTRSARWHEAVDLDQAAEERRPRREHIAIDIREGTMRAFVGDWIIREQITSVDRIFYPCKPDIFQATYEAVA